MEKVRYVISDAAKLVKVESHVLRYWEEELELEIPRNEMGHRYYTKDNIAQFQKIKEWKDQGYQLKAIKSLLQKGTLTPPDVMKTQDVVQAEVRMEQFRELMSELIGTAVERNNEELTLAIGKEVQELVLKEMNYLMREQDAAEEERFRKLDAAIRGRVRKKHLFFRKSENPNYIKKTV